MFKAIKLNSNFIYYLYIPLGIILGWLLALTPPLASANQTITDQLQGVISARKDVVIIGIDDKSLQQIGAWPWNRDIFAKALSNLEEAKPRAVGLDILFLESRQGDDQLSAYLNNSEMPIVFGAKSDNNKILESPLVPQNKSNITSALIDFSPDTDGKIRTATLTKQVSGECYSSFAFALFKNSVLDKTPSNCSQAQVKVRQQSFQQNYNFEYAKNQFETYSFSDLYNNSIDKANLEGKIVLIGSTSKDLKNNLNDNFTSVFGQQIAGVEIHANVVNSLLENINRQQINPWLNYLIFTLIYSVLIGLWFKWPKMQNVLINQFLCLIVINIFGAVLFGLGYIWLFLSSSFGLIGGFGGFLAFESATKGKQNKFISETFSQYLSPALLAEVLKNPDQLKLGGSKKTVTILFSDIRGFTSLAETMSPEELVHLTNLYLDSAGEVILNQQGTIDKYIGDCIMALWNAPLDNPKHALLAMQTTLLMQTSLQQFNAQHPEFKDLKIGIGLNSGNVIVGNIGGKKRFEYTVLGDNVNLASRLEGLTKKYGIEILVSKAVLEIAGLDLSQDSHFFGSFEGGLYRQIDLVQVKGKQAGVAIYELLQPTQSNTDLVQQFSLGYKLYSEGKYTEASKIFANLPDDSVSKLLLERIKNMSAIEMTKFNGVYIWDDK